MGNHARELEQPIAQIVRASEIQPVLCLHTDACRKPCRMGVGDWRLGTGWELEIGDLGQDGSWRLVTWELTGELSRGGELPITARRLGRRKNRRRRAARG